MMKAIRYVALMLTVGFATISAAQNEAGYC
jgi:hypothetical protein